MSTWPDAPGTHAPDATGAHAPDATAYADTFSASEGAQDKADRASLGELVSDISEGLSTLLRQEVELAKAEARESATRAGKAAGQFGAAALAGWMTLLFLSLGVWEWLSNAMESRGWAAIVVMAVWGIAAAVLAMLGRRTTRQIQGMPRTTETAKRVPGALMGNEDAR
ncbi:phage holin family protein [Terrabacter sp. LjRoot27]|jgi:hypothetical protein|uniref:phage holin family protein n=1 Tax=Terrabacter sp. LjRoot27 TaxID=3342306 RepID=UPI003ED0F3F2